MNKLLFFILIMLTAGCKEKYVSPVPPVTTGYLVIEGVVNNGGGETSLRLSRTTSLNDDRNISEKGAQVTLESSDNGNSIPLIENGDGKYTVSSLHLDTALRYRLTINTSNNEQYESDFVAVRNNPPIDTVSWVRDNAGVTLYINTHDPLNNTLYYQWEYNETWEFHTSYIPSLKFIKDPVDGSNIGVTPRDASDPEIYTCWQFDASHELKLGSSAKLSRDQIYLPLVTIEPASWKMSVLYSILVKQYSWSKQGFEFLERMKKNTETMGSVFDAQPSELNGNYRCTTNPNQPVIGFFNICTVRQQRIFIRNDELPNWGYRMACGEELIDNQPDSIRKKTGGRLPTNAKDRGPLNSILTFYAAPEGCVDCTINGVNVKPPYWP